MKRLIVLTGESGIGKTTIQNALVEESPLIKLASTGDLFKSLSGSLYGFGLQDFDFPNPKEPLLQKQALKWWVETGHLASGLAEYEDLKEFGCIDGNQAILIAEILRAVDPKFHVKAALAIASLVDSPFFVMDVINREEYGDLLEVCKQVGGFSILPVALFCKNPVSREGGRREAVFQHPDTARNLAWRSYAYTLEEIPRIIDSLKEEISYIYQKR